MTRDAVNTEADPVILALTVRAEAKQDAAWQT